MGTRLHSHRDTPYKLRIPSFQGSLLAQDLPEDRLYHAVL